MKLEHQESEENSTRGAAEDTTVPPVGVPNPGDPAVQPPPNPADRIQEQAAKAAQANAAQLSTAAELAAGLSQESLGQGDAAPLEDMSNSTAVADDILIADGSLSLDSGSLAQENLEEVELAPILLVAPYDDEVIRIDARGHLFWHTREVETDTDFRMAMLDLAEHMRAAMKPVMIVTPKPVPDDVLELQSVVHQRLHLAAEKTLSEFEARTAVDGAEIVAMMRLELTLFESCIALGRHEEAHASRAFLEHCAARLTRHIP